MSGIAERPVIGIRADGFCQIYWRKAICFQNQLISTQNKTKPNKTRKYYSKYTEKGQRTHFYGLRNNADDIEQNKLFQLLT